MGTRVVQRPVSPPIETKAALRRRILAARAGRGPDAGLAATHLTRLMSGVRRVASYVSLPSEASTSAWHEGLALAGVSLLLPRLLASGDLELAEGPLRPGLRGTLAPTGPAQPWAVAELVVVPALAVSASGVRLGRGGGSYDRALRGVRPGVAVVALLTDPSELLPELPREPHDVAVTAVCLPTGLLFLD